ncbi:hypothetical protein PATSB16_07330 [Pandoraea thiooxydans]|uniref:hypothetical protein n=1 Tax=Pandoraea thiooxydans TaxID=445709 RepID=UPI00094A703A|nr:hypothetical protein [Pandoraea thiooxydans]APR94075.1 hypothetical protein PATSB16_07330 [Pandoraea thiooxydans]
MSSTSKPFIDVSEMRAPLLAWRHFNVFQRDLDANSGTRAVLLNEHDLQPLF